MKILMLFGATISTFVAKRLFMSDILKELFFVKQGVGADLAVDPKKVIGAGLLKTVTEQSPHRRYTDTVETQEAVATDDIKVENVDHVEATKI